jgi:Zn-dependent alcohol dehydrogenase
MRAAVLDEPGRPLRVAEVAEPLPGPGQLLLRVEACGVCRTDLHLRDGEVEALMVYDHVGVSVLKKAWINLDAVWAGAFVLAGVLTLFT